MLNIHQLLSRIPNSPELQPIRLALEAIARESVTGAEVREFVTGTDFSFKTTTGSDGREVTRLVPEIVGGGYFGDRLVPDIIERQGG